MNEVSVILSAIETGDKHATEQLLPVVYAELRRLAAHRLAAEPSGQTLQATALVHEAYLRLVGPGDDRRWDGRNHFFAAAAEAMRRILVEAVRRKQGVKHGGHFKRVDAELDLMFDDGKPVDVLDLDEALEKLAKESPARAELVRLRFFAGMTCAEAAEVLGVSVATAERYWTYARTWLYAELAEKNAVDDHPKNNSNP